MDSFSKIATPSVIALVTNTTALVYKRLFSFPPIQRYQLPSLYYTHLSTVASFCIALHQLLCAIRGYFIWATERVPHYISVSYKITANIRKIRSLICPYRMFNYYIHTGIYYSCTQR